MGEWINTAEKLPDENEKVLIQLPATKNYTVARHTDGAFYDGYLRYCNIDWWQRIDPPTPILSVGDEIIWNNQTGVVVDVGGDGLCSVYLALKQCVFNLPAKDMRPTGVSYKEFAETIKALRERQKTL